MMLNIIYCVRYISTYYVIPTSHPWSTGFVCCSDFNIITRCTVYNSRRRRRHRRRRHRRHRRVFWEFVSLVMCFYDGTVRRATTVLLSAETDWRLRWRRRRQCRPPAEVPYSQQLRTRCVSCVCVCVSCVCLCVCVCACVCVCSMGICVWVSDVGHMYNTSALVGVCSI